MVQIVVKGIQLSGFGHPRLVNKHGLKVFEDEFLPLVESGTLRFLSLALIRAPFAKSICSLS